MIFVGFKCGYRHRHRNLRLRRALCARGRRRWCSASWRCAPLAQCFVQCGGPLGAGAVHLLPAPSRSPFTLTMQQIPHRLGLFMIHLSQTAGIGLFMLLSIAILIVMGSVLEGAAALIMFGPLLVPVAAQMGIDPLQFGIVLVISMGIGFFAPPIGLWPAHLLPDRRRAAGANGQADLLAISACCWLA